MQEVTLLNRAILGVLKSLDAKWQAFHVDDLTDAQEKALRLFVRAGLAEYRLEVWAKDDDGVEEQGYVFRLSGLFDDDLAKQILAFHPNWKPESLSQRISSAFDARLTISGVAERERMSGKADDGGFCYFLKSMSAAPARVRCEGRADTRGTEGTLNAPAGAPDETQQASQGKKTSKGGAPPKWDRLRTMIADADESGIDSDDDIAARFRQHNPQHPLRNEVNADKVREVRANMKRKPKMR